MITEIIKDRIRVEGPISFREFMEMALYYPGYGYYTSPHSEIGCKGDYYTSPHLHQAFGATIGRQIEEMWVLMERPSPFYIVEIGSGKGYLAGDMLDYIKDREVFKGIEYCIYELNPLLKKQQMDLLSPFKDKVRWLSSLEDIRYMNGCVLSNELVDAFPVHVIQTNKEGVKEVYVDHDGDGFKEILLECHPEIIDYIEEFALDLPDDYRTEVNLAIKDWLLDVSNVIDTGFLLTIDYGYPGWNYYHPERVKGTLLAYYQHKTNEDFYHHIGRQDLTAHVNFSALKKWGEGYGFKTIGYCPQGTFLVSSRIDEVMIDLFGERDDFILQAAKVKGLLLPQGMGESHKVLLQYRGKGTPCVTGFSLRNQIDQL